MLSPQATDYLRSVVGDAGIVSEDALAAMLVEWRGRWQGKTPLALAPSSADQVATIIRYCNDYQIPVTPQGGNTGLVGGQIPHNNEVLISMRRMNAVRRVSPDNNSMIVDAGVTLKEAQSAAENVHRLFPLSIGSEGSCQIGGVISTNAGGVNVLRYGNTRSLVLGLEAVMPNGDIWNGLKELRKDNTGYDLKQLLIGAEGTLGIITGAALSLFPEPAEKLSVVVAVSTVEKAVDLLSRAQAGSGGQVTSFELFSHATLELVLKNIPGTRRPVQSETDWYGLIEFSSGRQGLVRGMAEAVLSAGLEAEEIQDAVIAESLAQSNAFWRIRHSMSEAMKPEGRQAKHDVSVAVCDIPDFLKRADAAVEKVCPAARIIAFGHMGDGNIHYDIMRPLNMSDEVFWEKHGAIEQAVYDVIAGLDGSISAEHGIGVARRDDLARRKSPTELAAMKAIKMALDPNGIMNPGKILAENLK